MLIIYYPLKGVYGFLQLRNFKHKAQATKAVAMHKNNSQPAIIFLFGKRHDYLHKLIIVYPVIMNGFKFNITVKSLQKSICF